MRVTILFAIFLISYVFLSFVKADYSQKITTEDCKNDLPEVPYKWSVRKNLCEANKRSYINTKQESYDWFANIAFSESDGIPFVILKLLPLLDADQWGVGENFLDVVGLFPYNQGKEWQNYPIPQGVGFSGLTRDSDADKFLDYTSFTCGACHIGRVKGTNGNDQPLVGATNTTFDLIQFRIKLYDTLTDIYKGTECQQYNTEPSKLLDEQKVACVKDTLFTLIDDVQKKDPNYFYNDFSWGSTMFNADYEQKQLALFKQQANAVITKFVERTTLEVNAWTALVNLNYSHNERDNELTINPEMQDRTSKGFAGMADATGIATSNGWVKQAASGYPGGKFMVESGYRDGFPLTPGITDIMTVWRQDKRESRWNEDKTQLIDGGGQWTGEIPISIFRNIVAQTTLGLDNYDLRVSDLATDFLHGLPSDPYPFEINLELAKKGRPLYEKNCLACHKAHNGIVYNQLGTNMGRANNTNEVMNQNTQVNLIGYCGPNQVLMTSSEYQNVPKEEDGSISNIEYQKIIDNPDSTPCATFKGVSLVGKPSVIAKPTITPEERGYNARPMDGIWAQAPYLHNGSIPTLYHLLVPSERPDTFNKGLLSYDDKKVGFSWEQDQEEKTGSGSGYLYDTLLGLPFSNIGHDKDIKVDGNLLRLNWSDDKAGARSIVEYMKLF
jgi:hypothetical protein